MLNVYFGSIQEVICFCDHFFAHNKQIKINWETNNERGNHLRIEFPKWDEQLEEAVKDAFICVFTKHRLTEQIKNIIEEVYYYTNIEEKERILRLAYWILDEENKEIEIIKILQETFLEIIREAREVYFDSIVKFRLQSFKKALIDHIGFAIDAFKQEEEHQAFVETLRKYVEEKDSKCEEIYLLQGNPFKFFKPSGDQYSTLELTSIMYKEPLYIVGLDEREPNLSPLLTLAPKKIKIYGDYPSEPNTLTIINVFQERVEFVPLDHFPFSSE